VETLKKCRYLQQFFESTDFYTMSPHDELAAGGTRWVLADPGRSYIAYSEKLEKAIGVRGLKPGEYDLTWLDCRTGKTATARQTAKETDGTFARPDSIGPWCAVWIRRAETKP
jgi:hypothetical protein